MNGGLVQAKIYRGYAVAAANLGAGFALFRASSTVNPLAPGNQVATVSAVLSLDADFAQPNKYGNALWKVLVDGTQTKVGDYLVGAEMWFIAEMAPLLPILAVQCNRVLPISRLAQVAYDASPGVVNVTGITINGIAADLALTQVQCAQAGSITVS